MRDFIALSVFLVVAITTSRLAANARFQASEADARAAESKMIYMVSQVVGREIDTAQLLQTLTEEVLRMCSASFCAVLRYLPSNENVAISAYASVGVPSDEIADVLERHALDVLSQQVSPAYQTNWDLEETIAHPMSLTKRIMGEAGGLYLPLEIDGTTLGLMCVGDKVDESEFASRDYRLIVTLGGQAAVVLARDRLTEEATRQAQQFAILGERNRLAKEVHDTLSHAFTGIRFLLEAASVSRQEEMQELVSQARDLAINGAQEARRSVWALRPIALVGGAGLVKAVRDMVQQQTRRTSIIAVVNVAGDERALSDEQEDNLLRICQEAVTNVIRHAQASRVDLLITYEAEMLMIAISDNGVGFTEAARNEGFGLSNIRDRCAQMCATMTVRSAPDRGTEIVVRLPII